MGMAMSIFVRWWRSFGPTMTETVVTWQTSSGRAHCLPLHVRLRVWNHLGIALHDTVVFKTVKVQLTLHANASLQGTASTAMIRKSTTMAVWK
eukprot:676048-Amphidinium_carterae.2